MPNGCSEWTRGTNKQHYGIAWNGTKSVLAHRLAWELAVGPIPDGEIIRHFVCDNPPCCDVSHLRPGTRAENTADMLSKGRQRNQRKTHCPRGHEYTEDNTYLKNDGGRQCRACIRVRYYLHRGVPARVLVVSHP